MNQDFVEMLAALSEAGADLLIVGAHAMAAYAEPRATGDLGVWGSTLRGRIGPRSRPWA
jgi:hypothetical protein